MMSCSSCCVLYAVGLLVVFAGWPTFTFDFGVRESRHKDVIVAFEQQEGSVAIHLSHHRKQQP